MQFLEILTVGKDCERACLLLLETIEKKDSIFRSGRNVCKIQNDIRIEIEIVRISDISMEFVKRETIKKSRQRYLVVFPDVHLSYRTTWVRLA